MGRAQCFDVLLNLWCVCSAGAALPTTTTMAPSTTSAPADVGGVDAWPLVSLSRFHVPQAYLLDSGGFSHILMFLKVGILQVATLSNFSSSTMALFLQR